LGLRFQAEGYGEIDFGTWGGGDLRNSIERAVGSPVLLDTVWWVQGETVSIEKKDGRKTIFRQTGSRASPLN